MKNSATQPTAQTQIRFLERIQRILPEGQFTATYKFALLHALADLCIRQSPSTPEAPLRVIYVSDATSGSIFVITAYDLGPKARLAL